MKIIVPPENCINVSELTDNYLIICYVNGKPKGVICSTEYGDEYEFRTNSSYDDYWDNKINNGNSIVEIINNILEVYPNATFEAYE